MKLHELLHNNACAGVSGDIEELARQIGILREAINDPCCEIGFCIRLYKRTLFAYNNLSEPQIRLLDENLNTLEIFALDDYDTDKKLAEAIIRKDNSIY